MGRNRTSGLAGQMRLSGAALALIALPCSGFADVFRGVWCTTGQGWNTALGGEMTIDDNALSREGEYCARRLTMRPGHPMGWQMRVSCFGDDGETEKWLFVTTSEDENTLWIWPGHGPAEEFVRCGDYTG